MRVPIICMDERLRQFVRAFRSCFSLPHYRYCVIVLLALMLCQEPRTLTALLRCVAVPDWLALVGDKADGYPGLSGWGPKSASAVLSRYEHIESIPDDPGRWALGSARAQQLSERLRAHSEDVLLYRRLATLRRDVPLQERNADLEWRGAHQRLKALCRELGAEKFAERVPRWISELEAA